MGEDGHTSTTFEYLNIQITFDSKELRKNNDGGDKNIILLNAANNLLLATNYLLPI